MLSRSVTRSQRIPLLRPLRPPSGRAAQHRPRLFGQTSRVRIISRNSTRPQLPYLSQPTLFHQQPFLNYQISRLLATETRQRIVAQVFLTAKWFVIVWAFIFLGSVAWMGILMEVAERERPTPKEWRFWTRQDLRNARKEMGTDGQRSKLTVDWARAGSYLKEVLRRLESDEYDGQGLVPPGGAQDGLPAEEILIPGIGKAGYDITAKSYEWRTCYFEVLKGCALAAEHLDGMVRDTTRRQVFPASMVVGPSNPDPRPVPTFMGGGIAPLEENCERAFLGPEVYYMRILTGKGFTTTQKLDAAEGYANWLDFKRLRSSSEEMYLWAIDIAKDAMPTPAELVVDGSTNVLSEEAGSEATSNLLRAIKGLAVHHARTGNVSAALPMLLSVLRARSTAPVSTDPLSSQADDDHAQQPRSDIGEAVSLVGKLFKTSHFPLAPPTGDEPLTRSSAAPTCEESELMLYIGEILFANDDDDERRREGLGWTRQATRIAEMNLGDAKKRFSPSQAAESKKCKECLLTGVQNWETMLQRLSTTQKATAAREGGRNAGWMEWRGWFGRDGGVKGAVTSELAEGVVEEELKQVTLLKQKALRQNLEEVTGER